MEKQLKVVYSKKEPVNKNVVWLHPDSLRTVVIKIYNNGEWTPLSVAELPTTIEQAFKDIDNRDNIQESIISEIITYSSELGEIVEGNTNKINEHTQSINRTAANIISLSSTITNIENKQKEASSFLSKLKTAFNTTNLDEIISKLETLK
jgi:hypothetical protein